MTDASAIHDQVFRLAVFRRQSISYYRLFSVDELSAQQLGATFPRFPATTQEDRLEWHEINELGRNLYEQVCSHCLRLSIHASAFSYDVHRHLVRPGQVIVRLEYLSPALPHLTDLTVLASVCRSWNISIGRIVQGQYTVNHRRLLVLAQRGFLTFYWSHSFHEDRFTYYADLIPETLLQRVQSPVHNMKNAPSRCIVVPKMSEPRTCLHCFFSRPLLTFVLLLVAF